MLARPRTLDERNGTPVALARAMAWPLLDTFTGEPLGTDTTCGGADEMMESSELTKIGIYALAKLHNRPCSYAMARRTMSATSLERPVRPFRRRSTEPANDRR